jgi:tetratricopeptide (TPR) repeat protein
MTAADKYYLKAKEYYPFDLEIALEALDYGLSCDSGHPALLTLMGTVYWKNLKQFDAARENFELALYHDNSFVDAYYAYTMFAITMDEFKKAEKLVAAALKVKGADHAHIYYCEALLKEKQQKYTAAIDSLRKAAQYCMKKECYSSYQEEIERIQLKNKDLKEYKAQINIVLK